jgi:diguanylate cyclase (GGDEF)-like protein
MDKLAQLTTTANFPNKALEGRIQGIIDGIVTDYESDSAVFDSALTEVDKLVAQQERALTRNVERVVRTQEGNEKLRHAQMAVSKVLGERIAPPSAPSVLVNLVDSGWRDLLVLTHIKEGPDSQAWKDHIKTLDLLTQWLGEQAEGSIDDDVIMQRGMEAEPLIDMIDQQISAALPTSVDHESVLESLREILAGRESIRLIEVDPEPGMAPAPDQVRAKIENLPRLRRWIRRVEELEIGTWLSYKDKSGKKRRMQLAWVNEAKDRYIFVNERGQKNADLTSVQLARQLGRGVQPPPRTDKLSLIDRSMFDTLEHVQKSLSFAKNYDSLTKLINRDTFIDQMNRAFRHAQRKHSQHAVLCLNIDNFNLVNEVYDRVTGDQVLAEFARLLSQLHGSKSSSARLQDDEFAVLLLDRSMDQAVHYAEKIRSDIEASSVEIEGEKVSFTVSIGIAPMVDYCPGVEQILSSANSAMRLAKNGGRNRVVVFKEDEEQARVYQHEQAQARAEIKHTIETDRFVLQAQPIVQTLVESGATTSQHFELLLGLLEDDGSLSSPQSFIENAERYGYMTLVDRWVVKEAFEWISHLVDNQKIVPNISVNLSGTSVTDDTFMEYLLEQISEFGVGTNRLCFEITETGTISNLVKAADFVRTFRNIGCKFSIDDFGTGLASHNYLRELPVDYVKIDGTFITEINENRNDYAMARSINDLAHFLGQETIAESVENDEIIKSLQEIGVDYLQGWGIGKPKLLTEVTDLLGNIEK